MNMRTPLSTVTGLGSAKEGTSHFWWQRLTALANVPLTLFLVWFIIKMAGSTSAEMAAMVSNPIVAGLLIMMVVSVSWHMRLGMQVVIEDYIHGEGMKIALVVGNIFFSLAVAVLSTVSILILGFGS